MSSHVDRLWQLLKGQAYLPAIYWGGAEHGARRLGDAAEAWRARLRSSGIGQGTVCAFRGDYSLGTCALMLALAREGAIMVPFTRGPASVIERLAEIAGVQRLIDFHEDDQAEIGPPLDAPSVALIERLRATGHAGLVVFSSGSTGEPKAVLHDMERVLAKFQTPRQPYRTLQFLLMDHFGGLNTLFSVFSSGGVVVIPEDRRPAAIGRLIERAQIELLPVTPTFLNLFLATRCQERYDLSSVRLITYGTEVMPEATLQRLRDAFPNARLQQTYGLSETGVLRSRSRDSGSLWVKVGGEGFETRVVEGQLHVRSAYAMVGYLNAPDPFDAEGWLNTGDAVVQDGEWLRILGRTSDLVNVGGQKVFPAEVEDVLLQADNVLDATVHGEPHPLVGSIVVADIVLAQPEDPADLRRRLRAFCLERLAPYKVPVKFAATSTRHTERFKKVRD